MDPLSKAGINGGGGNASPSSPATREGKTAPSVLINLVLLSFRSSGSLTKVVKYKAEAARSTHRHLPILLVTPCCCCSLPPLKGPQSIKSVRSSWGMSSPLGRRRRTDHDQSRGYGGQSWRRRRSDRDRKQGCRVGNSIGFLFVRLLST